MGAARLAVLSAANSFRPLGRVSGGMLCALLLLCLFAPYGLLSAGGGALRPDHVAVYAIFGWCLITGRLRRPEPLALALFGFVLITTLSTAAFLQFVRLGPMQTLKNVDALLRAPMVLTVAASFNGSPKGTRRLKTTLLVVAVVLAAMALCERVLPLGSPVIQKWVSWYGGTGYTTGIYAELGVNHKTLMLMTGRATAVFVTAPALGMVAIFLLGLSIANVGTAFASDRWRAVVAVAVIVAGIASNSKSFLLGFPLLLAVSMIAHRRLSRAATVVLIVVAVAGFFGVASGQITAQTLGLSENLTERAGAPEEAVDVWSGGRLSSSGSPVVEATRAVLSDSPLLGYGFGQNPAIYWYADSGLNRFLLHGGLISFAVFCAGVGYQLAWLRRRHAVSPWSAVGVQTLVMALALFVAGPVLMMPRVNDVFAVLLGLSIALTRRDEAAARRAARASGQSGA